MSYLYDRLNRRRSDTSPIQRNEDEIPTIDDYNELLHSYRNLHSRYDQQSAELRTKLSELAIKDEALQRQGADLKQIEAELLFFKASLQRDEGRENEVNWQQRYEQLQAELEQLRKRWEQRLQNDVTEARNRILLDMLPVADNLELALQHVHSLEGEQVSAFIGNLETIRRAFLETLRRYGVERQEPLGVPFDPHMHEAIGTVSSTDVPVDYIVQVVQSGYVDGERVLRPARVLVNSG